MQPASPRDPVCEALSHRDSRAMAHEWPTLSRIAKFFALALSLALLGSSAGGCRSQRIAGQPLYARSTGLLDTVRKVSALEAAPQVISERRAAEAIQLLEGVSKAGGRGLRALLRQAFGERADGVHVSWVRLLADELTGADVAAIAFRVDGPSGKYWEWFGEVRLSGDQVSLNSWTSSGTLGPPEAYKLERKVMPLPPPTDPQDLFSSGREVMAVMSTDRWDQVILRAAAELRERGWGAAERWSHGGVVIGVMQKDYEQVREYLEARAEYAKYMVPRSHPVPWDWINRTR